MTETKKTSLPVAVETGKSYAWCSCGLSKTMPLCDGSHQSSDTGKQPLNFVAEQTGTVFLCACARTDTGPFCDGINCD